MQRPVVEGRGFDIDGAVATLRSIYDDPGLSKFQKRVRAMPIKAAGRRESKRLSKELVKIEAEVRPQIQQKERFIAVLTDMAESWGDDPGTLNPQLQKNDCSRLHRLVDAHHEARVYDVQSEERPFPAVLAEGAHPFVVAHDWAAVLGNASDIEGDIVLPYPHCAFEFRYGGRNVIVIAFQRQDDKDPGSHPAAIGFFEARNGDWCSMGGVGLDDYPEGAACFWWKQIRAICIALDAEVASHEVKRAPHALNVKRAKAGHTPLYDFHVVDLAKRHRLASKTSGQSGSKKRLHFCRGHWRHFESHKTWIRWCLKGDPDLGFVDKEYSL